MKAEVISVIALLGRPRMRLVEQRLIDHGSPRTELGPKRRALSTLLRGMASPQIPSGAGAVMRKMPEPVRVTTVSFPS